MDELTIRPATPADHSAIVAIFNRAFAGSLDHHQLETVDSLRSNPAEATILVGLVHGKSAGIAYLVNLDSGGVHFGTLAVDPAHQRKGLGQDFVTQVFGELRRMGKKWVTYIADPESAGTHQIGGRYGAMPLPAVENAYLIKL